MIHTLSAASYLMFHVIQIVEEVAVEEEEAEGEEDEEDTDEESESEEEGKCTMNTLRLDARRLVSHFLVQIQRLRRSKKYWLPPRRKNWNCWKTVRNSQLLKEVALGDRAHNCHSNHSRKRRRSG